MEPGVKPSEIRAAQRLALRRRWRCREARRDQRGGAEFGGRAGVADTGDREELPRVGQVLAAPEVLVTHPVRAHDSIRRYQMNSARGGVLRCAAAMRPGFTPAVTSTSWPCGSCPGYARICHRPA